MLYITSFQVLIYLITRSLCRLTTFIQFPLPQTPLVNTNLISFSINLWGFRCITDIQHCVSSYNDRYNMIQYLFTLQMVTMVSMAVICHHTRYYIITISPLNLPHLFLSSPYSFPFGNHLFTLCICDCLGFVTFVPLFY